jgi:hypothetical protein
VAVKASGEERTVDADQNFGVLLALVPLKQLEARMLWMSREFALEKLQSEQEY